MASIAGNKLKVEAEGFEDGEDFFDLAGGLALLDIADHTQPAPAAKGNVLLRETKRLTPLANAHPELSCIFHNLPNGNISRFRALGKQKIPDRE